MIQWVACDPATGQVIESLPGLRLESSLPCYVGRGDNVRTSLPVPQRPARWQIATEPNRAVLVAHHDDDAQTVLWAGPITYRDYGSSDQITIVAQSVDGWLASQYTGTVFGGTYTATGRDQSLILADMLACAAAQFHGRIDTTLSGVTRNLKVADSDDKTVASVIQQVMGLSGGPEYRIGWEWDANGCLVLVGTVAQRIGGTQPAALLTGLEWSRTDDYTAGKGATIVTAVAANSGAVRPQATRTASALLAAGYLPTEYRWSPDSGATTATLGLYADAKLAAVQQGTSGYSVSFHPDNPLMLNRDFRVGDVIEMDLENPDMPEATLTLTARMLGWVADADRTSGEIVKITPVLEGA